MTSKITQDPPTSSLIFPTASSNFSKTLADIKRSTLSILNRLRSLQQDSEYVRSVADTYSLPLVANERCGSWYMPPERKDASVYFKSTDGHTRQWKFSLRRLNLHVLDVIAEQGGCVIVDSTRRGKSMPDALSKTIPIWCCVLNRVLFPDNNGSHLLHLPSDVISASERSQIEDRLDDFVQRFVDLQLPLFSLRRTLDKPLRPVWVRPDTLLPCDIPIDTNKFHPVVLCTASRCDAAEDWYVQGAGDDSEGWAHGLTATLYWANRKRLMRTPEGELEEVIAELVTKAEKPKDAGSTLIEPTLGLYVGTSAAAAAATSNNCGGGEGDFDLVIDCSSIEKREAPDQIEPQQPNTKTKTKMLTLNCGTGKLGSRALRKQLPHAAAFITSHLNHLLNEHNQEQKPAFRLLATCRTGTDLAIGVALMACCMFYDDNGRISIVSTVERGREIDKDLVRRRLSWIMVSVPSAGPSRSTLLAVNSFLMDGRGRM